MMDIVYGGSAMVAVMGSTLMVFLRNFIPPVLGFTLSDRMRVYNRMKIPNRISLISVCFIIYRLSIVCTNSKAHSLWVFSVLWSFLLSYL